MKVTPGSTDVTTYFVLRLTADGTEATALTVTNFDLQYVRSGAAPAAKVDASALAATDSAHSDNSAIEIDATDQPGLYRVDWPDAAFAAGVREVILSVKCATCFTEHLRVELETLQTGDSYGRLGAPSGASVSADIATRATPAQILTTALTEAYAADGAAPTLSQLLFLLLAALTEFSISGTTITVKKLDGTTTAAEYTLDSATSPTSRTRAS